MTTHIALFAGAHKGIGLETARQLGARGTSVLLGARDERRGGDAEALLRQEGADARFVPLDVTGEGSARSAAPPLGGMTDNQSYDLFFWVRPIGGPPRDDRPGRCGPGPEGTGEPRWHHPTGDGQPWPYAPSSRSPLCSAPPASRPRRPPPPWRSPRSPRRRPPPPS
nr:SDR family NAD(P)-dependent oxidoreductase [Streptomyces sp. CZ24]